MWRIYYMSCIIKLVLFIIFVLGFQSQCPHCSFETKTNLIENNFVLSIH